MLTPFELAGCTRATICLLLFGVSIILSLQPASTCIPKGGCHLPSRNATPPNEICFIILQQDTYTMVRLSIRIRFVWVSTLNWIAYLSSSSNKIVTHQKLYFPGGHSPAGNHQNKLPNTSLYNALSTTKLTQVSNIQSHLDNGHGATVSLLILKGRIVRS